MIRVWTIAVAIVVAAPFWTSGAGPARAHDARPLFIQIEERDAGVYALAWRAPPSVTREQAPRVALGGCAPVSKSRPETARPGGAGAAVFDCSALEGPPTLDIAYGLYNPSLSTLVRLAFLDGQSQSSSLPPTVSRWTLPETADFASVARSYFAIGVDHIWGGPDHLLFLAGLLFIARTPARVLVTVTGFTLAHSLTIFLVALDVLRVSVPAVETVIALSIVVLAAEIARGDRTTLVWRKPVVASAAFGLVHGAGFASALAAIGLPQSEKIAALAFFNIGVEAGQVAVIAGVFAVLAALRRLKAGAFLAARAPRLRGRLGAGFAYGLGLVSALWFVERLAGALA